MKNIKTLVMGMASLLLCNISFAQQNYKYESVPGDPLNTRIYTLSNGLKVFLTVYKDAPRIQTYISVRVGSKNDPKETTGLAHYFEHMMFKGTQKFGTSDWEKEKPLVEKIESLFEVYRKQTDPALRAATYHQIDSLSYLASTYAIPNEYDKLMKAIGSQGTNAATSNDYTVYLEDIPANQIENWAKIQSDRFSNPVLRLFHTELETVYEEKNMSLSNDNRKSNDAMLKALFPNHPYGTQTTLGEQEHLKNPSMKNIREFFAKYYVPNNMAIIMSGDLDPDLTIQTIDKYFGGLKSKPLPEFTFTKETPITIPIEKEVVGLDAEILRMAYRFDGVNSPDHNILEMLSYMLYNDKAGLMDVNVNQKQKVLSVSGGVYNLVDYSALVFVARPKSGQSLQEVRDVLLEQIEKLKKGDFPDWMLEATINNLTLDRLHQYESNKSRAEMLSRVFLNRGTLEEELNSINEMKKITKQQIIDFANKYLGNNYVVIYKKQGTPTDVIKVEKPKITPIAINRDAESALLKEIKSTQVSEISPVFLDYDKDLSKLTTNNKSRVLYKQNTENNTFNLVYHFKLGKFNDPMMQLAMYYISYLGSSKLTCAEFNQELYKIASDFVPGMNNEETQIQISGLDENMVKAMDLVDDLFHNPQPDKTALDNMINDILKQRANNKLNQNANFAALVDYATYGENSPQRYILSETELKAITPDQLTSKIKELFTIEHSILYYGPLKSDKLLDILNKRNNANIVLKAPAKAKVFMPLETSENKVFFANYEAKQSFLQLISKGGMYDVNLAPAAALYNGYFGGSMNAIVFQELREKRSLAYSANSRYQTPSDLSKPYMNSSYIATQNDKVMDAFNAYNDLFNNMPTSDITFNLAKEGLISRINTERITKMNVIWSYLNAQKLGLDFDIRKELYLKIPSMNMTDVKAFNEKYIKNKTKTYVILGKESEVNLKDLEKLGKVTKLSQTDIFGF